MLLRNLNVRPVSKDLLPLSSHCTVTHTGCDQVQDHPPASTCPGTSYDAGHSWLDIAVSAEHAEVLFSNRYWRSVQAWTDRLVPSLCPSIQMLHVLQTLKCCLCNAAWIGYFVSNARLVMNWQTKASQVARLLGSHHSSRHMESGLEQCLTGHLIDFKMATSVYNSKVEINPHIVDVSQIWEEACTELGKKLHKLRFGKHVWSIAMYYFTSAGSAKGCMWKNCGPHLSKPSEHRYPSVK